VVADLTGDSTANRLLLEGELQVAGSTGATGSSASNINNVYFSGTGKVTSASGTEVVSSSSGSGGGGRSNKPKTPATPTAVNCAAGQMFSATTGAKCTQTVSSNDVSCPSGQMFDGVTGKKCTTWAGSSASGYAFGTTLVKSGTKGESCKAWQMYFNTKGANLSADGMCGPKTMAFAKTWQASVGLTADGVLGAMSRAKAQ